MSESDHNKKLEQAVCYRSFYYDSINKENKIAIPDFYIPSTNTIVEIKSNYTLNVQNMLDKKLAYENAGYKFKLILEHKETNLSNIYKNFRN